MSLDEAVDLVLFAFENGTSGDILVQKGAGVYHRDSAQAVKELFRSKDEIKIIGIRHGEKVYETLLTNEEIAPMRQTWVIFIECRVTSATKTTTSILPKAIPVAWC